MVEMGREGCNVRCFKPGPEGVQLGGANSSLA